MHSSGLSLGHISCDTCSVDASFRCNLSLSQTMHAFFSAGAASSAADGLPFVPLPGVSTCLQPPPYRPRCEQHPLHAPLYSPATGTLSSSPYHRHKHPCCITPSCSRYTTTSASAAVVSHLVPPEMCAAWTTTRGGLVFGSSCCHLEIEGGVDDAAAVDIVTYRCLARTS
jgi:hypothetical protein